MLKINKILSKKIQFPLSLQGLFPFCHSRESGNPSSLSLRGAKQRSNLKGFSLIELMVAVVILSIALIGIFLAFSSGWMGMANARDRTVATNYAREAMENVKNMEFELVTNGLLGIEEPVGAKFTRVIVVTEESDNLKKIDTKVSWTNRQSQEVSVETSMYINRTIFNPGEATHIILYADPYYTVLPGAGFATIIAAIKDINNTTVINWTGGDIRFSIDVASSSGSGYLSEDGTSTTLDVTPTNGIADTTFHGTDLGEVVIRASVDLPNGGGTISDTITITVTMGVVRITLSADTYSIDDDGIDFSTVTAALVDSIGDTVPTAENPITFDIDIFDSEGTLLDSTTEDKIPEGGVATIDVQSIEDTPGVATVTASSDGLISGTVNISIAGDAASISVSVVPDLIYTDDDVGAEVTLEIQDVSGNPVEYSGNITLSTSPESTGMFNVNGSDSNPTNTFVFDSTSPPFITYSSTSTTGFITIIAIGDGSISGNTDIEVREALIADTIILKADPKNILAGGLGGTDVSKITATIKQGSTVISNYNKDITFEIISDTSGSQNASLSYNFINYGTGPFTILGEYVDKGEVMVDLLPSDDVGICTVKVSTVNSLEVTIENTIEIGFYSGEHHIRLTAVPSKMLVNGDICIVTAVVEDENDFQVIGYSEDITFTMLGGWPKTAKFAATGTSSLTKTLMGGETTVILIPQSTAGTVILKASSFTDIIDITGYLNIPVVISLLELAPDPNINYDVINQVSFDIKVQGTEIILEEMQVFWEVGNPVETLDKIDIAGVTIYDNDPIVGSIVYTDNLNERVADIDVTNTTLSIDISTITMYFDTDISGKTFGVVFNPNSGNYHVEINEP